MSTICWDKWLSGREGGETMERHLYRVERVGVRERRGRGVAGESGT